ncbi:probable carboxylesterase 2 [Ziziphus jujuba]|uniref:Probable carboxylesterase 2 n=1 Tax=Ziziphus jujuba TaxID=326968 RepID=A0A6P4AB95_ZIZJJ|nr:probable carboxylesterase 2 [Ziziphus jujuba]
MDSSSKPEIVYELQPFLRVYKDGSVERLVGTDTVPPSTDPTTGVTSKDVTILPESQISARLYLPTLAIQNPHHKLPLLVYFPGSYFCVVSPFSSESHRFLNALVAEAKVIAVSVNYRKAPEHPIPTAYEDSWAVLQWIISHCDHGGPEAWLNEHADFQRVFLGGASAGANVVHNLALVAGDPDFGLSVELLGVALIHPYFWGSVPVGSEALQPEKKAFVDRIWPLVCPSVPDNDDPRINPVAEGAPSLAGVGCRRVLICVAEKDVLKDRGRFYYEALSRSGWMGVVEIDETEGEDHVFFSYDLEGQNSKDLINRLAAFFNRDLPPVF